MSETAGRAETDRSGGPALFWPRLLQPGYLLMHAVVLALFLATMQLGWWQWERSAARGWNVQNMSYAFQWPVFGLMGAWFYAKMMRLEVARDPAAEEPGSSVVLYQRPRIDTSGDPDLAAYNAHLARLNEQVLSKRVDPARRTSPHRQP